jgi:hypothetical protein
MVYGIVMTKRLKKSYILKSCLSILYLLGVFKSLYITKNINARCLCSEWMKGDQLYFLLALK